MVRFNYYSYLHFLIEIIFVIFIRRRWCNLRSRWSVNRDAGHFGMQRRFWILFVHVRRPYSPADSVVGTPSGWQTVIEVCLDINLFQAELLT